MVTSDEYVAGELLLFALVVAIGVGGRMEGVQYKRFNARLLDRPTIFQLLAQCYWSLQKESLNVMYAWLLCFFDNIPSD